MIGWLWIAESCQKIEKSSAEHVRWVSWCFVSAGDFMSVISELLNVACAQSLQYVGFGEIEGQSDAADANLSIGSGEDANEMLPATFRISVLL